MIEKYIKYTIVDTVGLVKRIGTSKSEDLEHISQVDETLILGWPDHPHSRWDGTQWIEIPEMPKYAVVFDINSNTWQDIRPFSEMKIKKWSEIKAIRDQKEFGGFVWNNNVFDSDQISQQRIIGAVQLASSDPNYSVVWTLANNTTISLSAQDMIDVGSALAQHVTQLHATAQQLREQINQAASAAELDLIQWPN